MAVCDAASAAARDAAGARPAASCVASGVAFCVAFCFGFRATFGAIGVVAFLAASPAARASQKDDLALLTLVPGPISYPAESTAAATAAPFVGRCVGGGAPVLPERPGWGPGEELLWEIAVLGVRAGRVIARTEEPVQLDDMTVYPVRARVRSDAFLKAFGDVDASMTTFVDPWTATPVRMVNRMVTHELFNDAPGVTREDAVFTPVAIPAGTAAATLGRTVAGVLEQTGRGSPIRREAQVRASADVVDVLSLLPWLRSRVLLAGRTYCLELFHRRRLHRIDVVAGDLEPVGTAVGSFRGRRLDAQIQRADGRTPRLLQIWLSDDDDRVPLLLRSPEGLGSVEMRLVRRLRGRPLVRPARPLSSSSSSPSSSGASPAPASPSAGSPPATLPATPVATPAAANSHRGAPSSTDTGAARQPGG
jgi:hypothetical protein